MKNLKNRLFVFCRIKKTSYKVSTLNIIFLSIVFYLSLVYSRAFAWHDTGHMVVASVAYKNLDKKLAHVFDELLKNNSKDYPASNNFITASVWADDIKLHGVNFYNQWHYHDSFFSTDGTHLPKPYNSGKAYSILQKHMTLINSKLTTDYEKVFSLRFIIHIIGDMHQPMHNASRVTKEFPRGDLGGNFFKLTDQQYSNLHSLWDSGLKSLPEFDRPLSDDKSIWLDNYAEMLMSRYPITGFEKNIITANYKKWQSEHIEVVKNNAYQNIQPNTEPSNIYINDNLPIVDRQMVLAGYRLANALNCAFNAVQCIE